MLITDLANYDNNLKLQLNNNELIYKGGNIDLQFNSIINTAYDTIISNLNKLRNVFNTDPDPLFLIINKRTDVHQAKLDSFYRTGYNMYVDEDLIKIQKHISKHIYIDYQIIDSYYKYNQIVIVDEDISLNNDEIILVLNRVIKYLEENKTNIFSYKETITNLNKYRKDINAIAYIHVKIHQLLYNLWLCINYNIKDRNKILEYYYNNSNKFYIGVEAQVPNIMYAIFDYYNVENKERLDNEKLFQEEQERQLVEQERQLVEQERLRMEQEILQLVEQERQRMEQERLQLVEQERLRMEEEQRLWQEEYEKKNKSTNKSTNLNDIQLSLISISIGILCIIIIISFIFYKNNKYTKYINLNYIQLSLISISIGILCIIIIINF